MKLSFFLPCLLLFCQPALAKENPASGLPEGASIETDPKYPPVISYTLKNGLKMLILEKHFVPTVSLTMTFKVGNVDTPQGKTGLAHLFEHMAFKGSKTMNTSDYAKEKVVLDKIEAAAKELIAEESLYEAADNKKVEALRKKLADLEKEADNYAVTGELSRVYGELGENGLNAGTSNDYTTYMVSLPSSRLEAWMVLESDRFKNAVLREFYRERSVVMEERRMYESDPSFMMNEALSAAAFTAHPYRTHPLGWMDDLKRLTRTDAEKFFSDFYAPNNATLAVVGDVKPAEVISMAEKYFAGWKARDIVPASITKEPPQASEKRINVFVKAQPALRMAFHNPGLNDPDMYPLIMLSEILSSGKTARFYRNLVEGSQLALYAQASSMTPGIRYPSLFLVSASPKAPHTMEELETAVWAEIDLLKKEPPTPWEMERVINNYEADMVKQLEGSHDLSSNLSINQEILGDWKIDWKITEKLRALKPEDVSAAARKYFTRGNYTVVFLRQPEAPALTAAKGEAK
jgi:predicted Zn-dependent peptidase